MISIDLKNKTALVTGATGQLGRVMVRTLAKAGANIILHYHKNEIMAQKLKQEILSYQVKCFIVQADICNLESVLAMKNKIEKEFFMPDIIVNNAVISYSWKPILEQSIEDFDSQYQSCVLQQVCMAKAFAPAMIAKKYGRIIGINTECAMQCYPTQGAYAAAKRGMDGIIKVLAKELGAYHITVNEIAPGWTISDRDRENHSEVQPESDIHIPLKRRGTDQEVANAVLFLASDLASYITGCYLPVCGGNVMPSI